MSVHIRTAGVAATLILLTAAGAAGCGDSGGVAASIAKAAHGSSDAVESGAEHFNLPDNQISAMTDGLSQTTFVEGIDQALDGLDESQAGEVFDAACADTYKDGVTDDELDPGEEARAEKISEQFAAWSSYDQQRQVQAWEMCEVRGMVNTFGQ